MAAPLAKPFNSPVNSSLKVEVAPTAAREASPSVSPTMRVFQRFPLSQVFHVRSPWFSGSAVSKWITGLCTRSQGFPHTASRYGKFPNPRTRLSGTGDCRSSAYARQSRTALFPKCCRNFCVTRIPGYFCSGRKISFWHSKFLFHPCRPRDCRYNSWKRKNNIPYPVRYSFLFHTGSGFPLRN